MLIISFKYLDADLGGEEDSFVGQSSVAAPTISYFQSTGASLAPSVSDPFANVSQNPMDNALGLTSSAVLDAPSLRSVPSSAKAASPPTAIVSPVSAAQNDQSIDKSFTAAPLMSTNPPSSTGTR